MGDKRGCLKTGLLGCGALLALVVAGVLVLLLLAWLGRDDGARIEGPAAPEAGSESEFGVPGAQAATLLTTRHPGRVVLDLGEGEFQLRQAAPGAGLSVRATYDSAVHSLGYSFVVAPDSSWTAHISFHQTMPGLQALFRKLMGGDTDASIHVYLPPEVPLELAVGFSRGGGEAELGGLWLRTADFDFTQGGFALDFDEPLREPLARLRLHGRMGGVQVLRLGNASPHELVVDCAMGGADIQLKGAWRNDCDAELSVFMGGMDVRVPADVRVETDLEGGVQGGEVLRHADAETPVPVLRLSTKQKMGEIEIRR